MSKKEIFWIFGVLKNVILGVLIYIIFESLNKISENGVIGWDTQILLSVLFPTFSLIIEYIIYSRDWNNLFPFFIFFIKLNIYLKANTKIWRIYNANKTSYMDHLISNIIQKLTSTNQLMNLNALWNSIFISSGMVKPILIEAKDSPAG